ncbi:MAG: hypothetical protein KDA97_13515 [Acidimicrobiales bacterium]|nr:hypothetical protein [Acidimicrobiales bacterium]
MDAPDTVVDAIARLRSQGYETEFRLDDGLLRGSDGDTHCTVDEAIVEKLYRFEGPSDPGDEMIVFALRAPSSGRRGYLASGFGPAADPEVLDHLTGLAARFGG